MLTARATGGRPAIGSESREVRWVQPDAARHLAMDRSMRLRINHYVQERAEPYLG